MYIPPEMGGFRTMVNDLIIVLIIVAVIAMTVIWVLSWKSQIKGKQLADLGEDLKAATQAINGLKAAIDSLRSPLASGNPSPPPVLPPSPSPALPPSPSPVLPPSHSPVLPSSRPAFHELVASYRSLVECVARTPGLREVEGEVIAFLDTWKMFDAKTLDGPPPHQRPADMQSIIWATELTGSYLCLPGYPSISDPASIVAGGGYVGHKMLGDYFDISRDDRSDGRLLLDLISPGHLSYSGFRWSVATKGQIKIRSQ